MRRKKGEESAICLGTKSKGLGFEEAKPTGYPSGSIPSSYQKHLGSKQLNFPIFPVWPKPPGFVSN